MDGLIREKEKHKIERKQFKKEHNAKIKMINEDHKIEMKKAKLELQKAKKDLKNTKRIYSLWGFKIYFFLSLLALMFLFSYGCWIIYEPSGSKLVAPLPIFAVGIIPVMVAYFIIFVQEEIIKKYFSRHIIGMKVLKYLFVIIAAYGLSNCFTIIKNNPINLIVSIIICIGLAIIMGLKRKYEYFCPTPRKGIVIKKTP